MAVCKKLERENICFGCKIFQIHLSANNSISTGKVAIGKATGQVTFVCKENSEGKE